MKIILTPFAAICLLFLTASAEAQPTYLTSATNVGNASSASVNKPTGTATNDLLIVGIAFEKGSGETVTPPSGWTLIVRSNNGTDVGISTYYKIAGSSEPSSYSFGLSNGSKWAIGCSRFSNYDTAFPIGVKAGATGNGSSVSAPSITTTANNSLVLCYYSNKKNSTYTPAGSTTERYDAPNTSDGMPSNMMATFVQATSGATGNKQATATDVESWSAIQIAIPAYIPIPIDLLFFNAFVSNNSSVHFEWKTATEINNDFFSIERSKDGNDWTIIGTIDGAGNSFAIRNYSFEDINPYNAVSYYRLKQTDFDGKFEYTDIKIIDFQAGKITIHGYPNPSQGQLTLDINRTSTSDVVQVDIMDIQGNSIETMTFEPNGSQNLITPVDISDYRNGLYIVRVVSGTFINNYKLNKF